MRNTLKKLVSLVMVLAMILPSTVISFADDTSSTLKDGTYTLSAEEFVFTKSESGKAKVTCEKVVVKDGKATAEFVMSSDSYTHFYMGV